jgi:hypothetical protein
MPIKMIPEEYYDAFVLGNYNDFIDNPSSVMKAFNAAVAASHLADFYYNYYKIHDPRLIQKYKGLGKFVADITKNTNNYFQDIRSIANAYKHLYTGIKQEYEKFSTISSAGTIESIVFEDEEVNQLTEELLDKDASDFIVVYTRKSGEQIQFKLAIEKVIDFWGNLINDI